MAISKYKRLPLVEDELVLFRKDLEILPCLEKFGGHYTFLVEKVIQLLWYKEKVVALVRVYRHEGFYSRYIVFAGAKDVWEIIISDDPNWSNEPPIFNFRKQPELVVKGSELYIGGENNFEHLGNKNFLHLAI